MESLIIDILRIYFIEVCTYYMNLKFINKADNLSKKKYIIVYLIIFVISIICIIIKKVFGFIYSIIGIIFFISLIFASFNKNNFINSLIVTVISLSINYILLAISIFIGYIFYTIINIQSEFINFCIIIFLYIVMVYYFLKIKKLKQGITFLYKKLENEYFAILIVNVSIIILFCIIILSNYNIISSNSFGARINNNCNYYVRNN